MADLRVMTNSTSRFKAKLTMRQGERLRTTDPSGNWYYGVLGVVMSNLVNDEAAVGLSISHKRAPHGEPEKPTPFLPQVFVAIDADDYSEGTHTLRDVHVDRHGEHYDIFRLVVKFTISSVWFADSITSLEADLSAQHTTKLPRGLRVSKARKAGPRLEKRRRALKRKHVEWHKSRE